MVWCALLFLLMYRITSSLCRMTCTRYYLYIVQNKTLKSRNILKRVISWSWVCVCVCVCYANCFSTFGRHTFRHVLLFCCCCCCLFLSFFHSIPFFCWFNHCKILLLILIESMCMAILGNERWVNGQNSKCFRMNWFLIDCMMHKGFVQYQTLSFESRKKRRADA